jgi:Fe-S-cluster containining protein
MGKTIVLTPFDMYNLQEGTGENFDSLLSTFKIELSMIDGIILPNLKMDKGCGFLKAGRCTVHKYRPGICRLFPMGRIYREKGFDYFLQINECAISDSDRTQVRVRDWLGIDYLEKNEAFINKWHRFLTFERKKISTIAEMASNEINRLKTGDEDSLRTLAHIYGEDELFDKIGEAAYREKRITMISEASQSETKEVMKKVIRCFYLEGYDISADFYQQFDERLKRCLSELRNIK